MDRLKLLQVSSHVRGFIEINGSAAGETSGAPLSLLIPDGRLLFSFSPLENTANQLFLPFSRILSLDCDPPCVVCDDGHIMLEVLPDQMIFARIDPPFIAKSQEMLPHILCSLSVPAGNKELRGIIYFDRTFNFSLEDPARKILFAYAFPKPITAPRLHTRRISGITFLFAEGQTERGKILLCVRVMGGDFFVFCERCARFELGDEIILYQDVGDPYGHLLAVHYRFSQNTLARSFEELVLLGEGSASSEELTALSFGLAMQYGAQELALSYLEDSLKSELSFADLREFFGEMSGVERALCREGALAFQYPVSGHTYYVRIFDLSFSFGKISNISER